MLWQHAVTGTAHTAGQEDGAMVDILAGRLLPVSPHLNYISISSSLFEHAAAADWALCLGRDWDGEGEVAHATREVERRQSERERGKPEGGEEEGRIERREREAILQTCDTLIINKLGLNA